MHDPEGLPPVAELAEKIKALREANTVEAAPERTVRKAARAERPVTARIRERMGPVEAAQEPVAVTPTPEPAKEREPVLQAEPEPVVIPMPETMGPMNGHAKAVAKRRQDKAAQLRLF